MHARELVELAGLIAHQGPLLLAGTAAPSASGLEQYWAASKFRIENWNWALKRCADHWIGRHLDNDERLLTCEELDHWVQIRPVLDEIFVSEILTRVWTAVLVAADRRWRSGVAEPIARNVFISHLEVRRRALALLLQAEHFSTRQAVSVNRVRNRADRWVDLLLAGLTRHCDPSEFAVDADRLADYAADLAETPRDSRVQCSWRLIVASLRGAFVTGLASEAANSQANARVAASLLGCLPDTLFDSTGLFHPLWMMRLAVGASDCQGLVSDLLGPEPPRRAIAKPTRRRA